MMTATHQQTHKKTVGSVRSYVFGFIFSVVLTLAAYVVYLQYQNPDNGGLAFEVAVALLLSFAVMQLFVQLIFFLHLGHESGPRWNLIFLVSTVSIFIMCVVGSIWIMYHLNYNMMPEKVGDYIMEKERIHK